MTFIPKQVREVEKERSYKLDRWQERAMLSMLGMITLSFIMSNLWAIWWQKSDWLVATVLPAVVVDLTNESRLKADTEILARDQLLDKAAQLKAEHMAAEGYFAHYSPSGVTPWHWFDEVGYNYQSAGENLAVHFTDSQAVVDAWLGSPSHRENIENSSFTEIGVGTARGRYNGYDTVFVVQMFGKPRETVSEVGEITSAEEGNDSDGQSDTLTAENDESLATNSEAVAGESTFSGSVVSTTSANYEAVDESTQQSEKVDQWVSDTATNSAPTSSATHGAATATVATSGGFWGVLATQPNLILQWVYITLSIVTVGMILWALRLEIKRRRLLQIGYSFGLLILMAGMWYVHTIITGSAVIG